MTASAAAGSTRRRGWRLLRRLLVAFGALFVLAVVAFFVVVHNLDTRVVKERLRHLVQSEAGLELDYATATVEVLSGLSLGQLTVESPPEYHDLAPLLLRAEEVKLGWSFFGKGSTLRKVTARDLEVTIIVDESGKTSLDSLGGGGPSAPSPVVTPGRRLADAMGQLPGFDRIALSRMTVNLLFLRAGRVVERARIEGLDLQALSSGAGPGRNVELDLGQSKSPLALVAAIEREGAPRGEAAGTLWMRLRLDAAVAELHARLAVDRQTLAAAWPARGALFAVDGKATAEHDRLRVVIDRLEGVEQAIVAHAALTLDPGQIRVEQAGGMFDLGRLARLAPRGPLLVEMHEGHLRCDVAGLELAAAPSLDEGGHVELEGRVMGLRVEGARHPAERVELDALRIEVKTHGLPGGGVKTNAELPFGTLHLEQGAARLEVAGGKIAVAATLPHGTAGHAEFRFQLASIAGQATPSATLHAGDAEVGLHLSDLRFDFAHPLATTATAALHANVALLDGQQGDLAVHAEDLKGTARARLAGGPPQELEVELPIGRLQVTGAGGGMLLPAGPARLAARMAHGHLDLAAPLRSTGEGHLEVSAGPLALKADVRKHPDAADIDLTASLPRASLLTAFAPASLALPGARMSLDLAASGRVDGLAGSPHLREHAHLHVDRPAATFSGQTLSSAALDLDLDLDGTLRRQELQLVLAPHALALEDEPLGDGKLTARLRWDPSLPALDVALDGEGGALPSGHLGLSAAWDRKTRALTYKLEGDLRHLAALEPLLPAALTDEHWIDLSDLHAKIASHGRLEGVVTSVDARGVPLLAESPLATLRGEDVLDLTLEAVHYVDDAGVELVVPSLALVSRLKVEGQTHAAHAELRMPRATLSARDHKLELSDLYDQLDASAEGDLRSGPIEASHRLTLGKLTHDLGHVYPIAGVELVTRLHRTTDGTLRLDELSLDNAGSGTRLRVEGALVLPRAFSGGAAPTQAAPIGFRSLALVASLEQRLDALAGDPERFRGSGTVRLEADVGSGDLHRFHVAGAARFHQASLELPAHRVRVVHVEGQVPVVEDVLVSGGHATLAAASSGNTYPQLRFSDQHAFLSGSGALRIERITVGDLTIDELAGNLRVARNVFAIDQAEAEVRGGRVAGQCLVDWRGPDSTASLRVRATGIEATHGGTRERFDANAALTFSLANRELDGRAEILRIGRHHLYDLLDEYDPHHTDVATNRVRTALALGYPDRVHVLFDHGFATLSVAFGGLAELVHVGAVKGIPMGPLLDRYLGPVLSSESP